MDTIDNGDEAVNDQHSASDHDLTGHADHDHVGHDHADHVSHEHDHADHEHHGEHVAATPVDGDDHGSPDRDAAGTDSLADLDSPGHLFDQTNGLADGLNGDSDGTAESDVTSDAERGDSDVVPGSDGADFNTNDRI
ncbi:hypothetical protein [Curtobacterium sp. RRHDQ10]|uniref:hypothetical protein n=1 Tax=Curtobacterium phyllosphaerae TaxID=3413379 RepID=UPI003BF3C821